MTSEHSPFARENLYAAAENCAREPVHIPGAVQRFGVLISLDAPLRRMLQVSANVNDYFGLAPEQALALKPVELLGRSLLSRLRKGLEGRDALPGALTVNRRFGGEHRRWHLAAFRSGDNVVIELEPMDGGTRYRWLSLVNDWVTQLVRTRSETDVIDCLTQAVRSITGYDRAVVYVFDESWNGRVIAEDRNQALPSLLGQHFPASDIPAQVRAQYLRCRVRAIADAGTEPVSLVPVLNPLDGKPLDLGAGVLRAVSPIHREYMRNMGTRSSVSVAIYSEEDLWGLVSCHSREPMTLSPSARDSAVTLVQVAAQRLFLLKAEADAAYRHAIHESRVQLSSGVQNRQAPRDLVHHYAGHWQRLFGADGLALVYLGEVTRVGTSPGEDDLRGLTNWLDARHKESEPWSTTSLREAGYPEAERLWDAGCCGLLAMPLLIDMDARGWLLLFRPEVLETIPWAGKPEKAARRQGDQWMLSPRQSFSAWVEEVRGQSRPWQPAELSGARDIGDDLAVIAAAHEITRLNEYLRRERKALEAANRHLEKVANTDALTGILNRYRIEHLVQMAMANAERYGPVFSLLLFDLDHFKQINDTHGHDVGDRILKTLVATLADGLREGDQIGRWGGEEFLILAPHTGLDDAVTLAERMRQRVTDTDFTLDDPVTISIGVAEWRRGDSLKSLLVRADRAMYEAKHAGRNRVCRQSDLS